MTNSPPRLHGLLLGASLLLVALGCSEQKPASSSQVPAELTEEQLITQARRHVEEASTRLSDLMQREWMQQLPFATTMAAAQNQLGGLSVLIQGDIMGRQHAEHLAKQAAAIHESVFDEQGAVGLLWSGAPLWERLHNLGGVLSSWFRMLQLPPEVTFEPDRRWRSLFVPRLDEAFRMLSQGLDVVANDKGDTQLKAAIGVTRKALEVGEGIRREIEAPVQQIYPIAKRFGRLAKLHEWGQDYEKQARKAENTEHFFTLLQRQEETLFALVGPWEDWKLQRLMGEGDAAPPASLIAALDAIEAAVTRAELAAIAKRIGIPAPPRL